jgi:hypothetical protein
MSILPFGLAFPEQLVKNQINVLSHARYRDFFHFLHFKQRAIDIRRTSD